VTPVQFLVDTSALVRIFREETVRRRWEQQITAGILAVCPVIELEFLYSARSKADRQELVELLRAAFAWVVVPDRAFDRATEVQALLTDLGAHRSAGAVDLLVAATAELHGLTLLHYDHDFDQIVRVTAQRAQCIASAGEFP
jgi:predicted nucleic acid-binding protein